jgi:hypothetical protein
MTYYNDIKNLINEEVKRLIDNDIKNLINEEVERLINENGALREIHFLLEENDFLKD